VKHHAERLTMPQFSARIIEGSGTRLRLTQAGFPNEELKERHVQAWPVVLDRLGQTT
jgi:hypothetical protein